MGFFSVDSFFLTLSYLSVGRRDLIKQFFKRPKRPLLLAITLLLVMLVFFFFPRDSKYYPDEDLLLEDNIEGYSVARKCECLGFGVEKTCYGLIYRCKDRLAE